MHIWYTVTTMCVHYKGIALDTCAGHRIMYVQAAAAGNITCSL